MEAGDATYLDLRVLVVQIPLQTSVPNKDSSPIFLMQVDACDDLNLDLGVYIYSSPDSDPNLVILLQTSAPKKNSSPILLIPVDAGDATYLDLRVLVVQIVL